MELGDRCSDMYMGRCLDFSSVLLREAKQQFRELRIDERDRCNDGFWCCQQNRARPLNIESDWDSFSA